MRYALMKKKKKEKILLLIDRSSFFRVRIFAYVSFTYIII